MQLTDNYKSWLEISRKSLLHNLDLFRKKVSKDIKIACVIKANAYGHGLKEVITILYKNSDFDWFAVDSLEEALEIRNLKVKKPILVLGFIPPVNINKAIVNNISFVVYSKDILKNIVSLKLKTKALIHLKVETGLNRQGLTKSDLLVLSKYIQKHNKILYLEGLYTHFANIEDTLDPSFSRIQLERFKETIKFLKSKKIRVRLIHCAASAAVLLHNKTHFNMIRVGIALYGLWPSKEIQIAMSLKKEKDQVKLEPAISFKSKIVQIKKVRAGESVGYGRTWFAPRDSRIGVVPVGYYDGFDRKLSNCGRILINGLYAPVVGRVAMNMFMVDLTDIKNVRSGDTVILLGKSGREAISAEEIAEKVGTINYEIVSRLNPNLPRFIV